MRVRARDYTVIDLYVILQRVHYQFFWTIIKNVDHSYKLKACRRKPIEFVDGTLPKAEL